MTRMFVTCRTQHVLVRKAPIALGVSRFWKLDGRDVVGTARNILTANGQPSGVTLGIIPRKSKLGSVEITPAVKMLSARTCGTIAGRIPQKSQRYVSVKLPSSRRSAEQKRRGTNTTTSYAALSSRPTPVRSVADRSSPPRTHAPIIATRAENRAACCARDATLIWGVLKARCFKGCSRTAKTGRHAMRSAADGH